MEDTTNAHLFDDDLAGNQFLLPNDTATESQSRSLQQPKRAWKTLGPRPKKKTRIEDMGNKSNRGRKTKKDAASASLNKKVSIFYSFSLLRLFKKQINESGAIIGL